LLVDLVVVDQELFLLVQDLLLQQEVLVIHLIQIPLKVIQVVQVLMV
jgi:hypothetical protein